MVAPAAGLHFSRELLKRLEIKGIYQAFLTLHSGLGNFREIDGVKDANHRVCAIGTSVLRAIASAVSMSAHMKTYTGWTNKFIFPPYDFTVTDALLTNFHLPYSTMLMMATAFGGYELVMKAYNEAVKEKYRFGAYGDAMLIL